MNNTLAKKFDAVQMVRTVRDEVSSKIATMSIEEENRWIRSAEFSDSNLRRLMELAAQQGTVADAAARLG
jgi:DNA-binding SARP family transcriptional activator